MAIKKLPLAALGIGLLAVGALLGTFAYYASPGPLAQETTIVFKHGEGFQAISEDMAQAGIIAHPLVFKGIAVALGQARKFKAGEYHFPAEVSPQLAMSMLAQGKVVVHKITVLEGWSVREIKQLLDNEPVLEGAVPGDVREGSLLPETYQFVYGDTRQEMIARMQHGMTALLNQLWDKRKPGLPFDTQAQALTLASIVEKETGVKEERGHVASVFINRLKLGMKLQSDPTVVYGIEQKTGAALGRSLTLGDLQASTPYNTYVIDGLPPGPIANPGRAAIEAVLNPPDTKDLYFVATGSGGHNFAPSLKEHEQNVQKYHAALRKQQ